MVKWIILGLLVVTCVGVIADRASTWDFCNCRFLEWSTWSSCTKQCYGRHYRDRLVRHTVKKGCTEFTDCATPGSGHDWDDCNKFCYNGGTYVSSYTGCKCVDGKYGRCCDKTVTCATPTKPANGTVLYSSLTYGSTITYSCHDDYNMTSGLSRRTCQNNGGWSGDAARCQYVNTCSSNPCKNGGSCINGVESYTCQCNPGWSGINCENDIQPPVMTGCSDDQLIHTHETSHNVTWSIPQFSDPMNKEIRMVTNYPEGFVVAPWGDHVVQYVATKPFNGLQTECKFTVQIRPNPCPELNIPINGARVCNGWKTEYARVCLVYCDKEFTLQLGSYSPQQWYVCGATGNWLPSGPLPNCTLPDIKIGSANNTPDYQYNSCHDDSVKQSYIRRLKSSNQKALCDKNPDECKSDNVSVDC
ncbi:sushi, von Willebrand factor type A, EGF and pentraxin domain-containing protein 1-like [Patella vulgata]|uniref:sushi, von Willebrand factor type A, EGF and pentraxin domain-containing protein 1-like n=1 Tax=Patella vulgata TaxID=6465 RepID=UPI00217F93C9|nr:sushi, von Willebrand factor type A, EGF and pentraxin domain-containing protein 1-like [Patella vulgata]